MIMAKTNGTITYPLKSGVLTSDANEAYGSLTTEFTTNKAFKDVSINPVLKTTYLESEHTGTGSATSDVVPSVIFTEIRKAPHAGSVSNDNTSSIGNRILPTNTTITSYSTNKEITPSFKIRVYDSKISDSETNRKFVYSTDDSPASDTLGIDIDNYDYFIMINPEIYDSTTRQDSVRPHFAKITTITTFDTFGDGLEFTPKYTGTIPKDTNFEIYKGPHKINDSDIVAVSYGLRGDNLASTNNYDAINIVATPTFYFYNERLEQENQLDYMEKYTLTRLRWFSTLTNITITDTDAHAKHQEGSGTVRFEVANSAHTNMLCEGMSIFNSSNIFLGNIKDITGNFFQLDFARVVITGSTSNNQVYKIGKGIQNIVFRTESNLKGTFTNLGKGNLDITLVDNLRNADDIDSNFNPLFWHTAFTNMKRHELDSTTPTANDANNFDGKMNGPSRYITSDPRPLVGDIVPFVGDRIINSPKNRISQIAKVDIGNQSGMVLKKYTNGQKMVVSNSVFNDNTRKKILPFTASKVSGSNTIRLNDLDSAYDYKLSGKITTNTMLIIDNRFYVVDAVNNKSGTHQDITVKASKIIFPPVNTFTVAGTVHEFTNESVYILSWSGVLNTEKFDSDTQVHYSDNNRLTISGATIQKEESKFYDTRVVYANLPSHLNKVDYIDKDMGYVKFQDADRKFYQDNTISRFYYYDGAFSLQEEIFNGTIEKSDSLQTQQPTARLEGRDTASALLNSTVNKNLSYSEDIIHSTINPVIPYSLTESLTNVSVSGKVITHSSGDGFTPTKYTLLFTRTSGIFIGEVASATSTAITLTHRPLINMSTTTNIYYYDPFIEPTYVSGTKAIGSNPVLTTRTTDFSSISDKGLIFQDSFSFDRNLNRTRLEGTSNSGSYLSNRTLGYDVAKPISINTLSSDVSSDDSTFAIQLSNELGASTTAKNFMSFSSERFDVVEIIEKDNGETTLKIAPIVPIVMGRIENNTLDTRSNFSLYLINNNLNSGGFIHRIDSQVDTGNLDSISSDDLWTPRETFRYWDLQKFNAGTLTRKGDDMYGKTPSLLKGYSIAYPIKGNGDASSATVSTTTKPLLGSNLVIDENYTLLNAINSPWRNLTWDGTSTPIVPPFELAHSGGTAGAVVTNKTVYNAKKILNYDGKAQNYELLSTGDLFPYSKLRYNNIGSQPLNYNDLSCVLESESATSSTITSHSEYIGSSSMSETKDSNYERMSIKSANKTTNEIKRFGIARLVEATFDWHFNPVDSDKLQTAENIENDLVGYQMSRARANYNELKLTRSGGLNHALSGYSGSISFDTGDCIFEASTGKMLLMVKSAFTYSSGSTITSSKYFHVNYTTSEWSSGAKNVYVVHEYTDLSHRLKTFTNGFQDPINSTDLRKDLSSVFLIRPNYVSEDDKFKYALLENGDSENFNPPNMFIPFVFQAGENVTSTPDMEDFNQSPFHPDDEWNSLLNNHAYRHSSRVIAALLQNRHSTASLTHIDKFGLDEYSHLYENCIAVFRNIRQLSSVGPDVSNIQQTSAILGSRQEHAAYVDYADSGLTAGRRDQHTVNTMVWRNSATSSIGYAISGSHTRSGQTNPNNQTFADGGTRYFLESKEGSKLSTTRHLYHTEPSENDGGGLYKAQMLVKPVLNMTDANITNGTTVTITVDINDADSAHTWLNFVPDLTGYYLVSESSIHSKSVTSLGVNDVTPNDATNLSSYNTINTTFIAKILSHTSNQTTNDDLAFVHTIVLDKAPTTYSSPRFRLMRFAETTFRDTPNEIIINRLFDTGLDYSTKTSHFMTGENELQRLAGITDYMQEGVFSMYVLVNTDSAPNTNNETHQMVISENYVQAFNRLPYNDGDTFECYVTDGNNSEQKNMMVSYGSPSSLLGIRRGELRLIYDGVLNGDGLVSFGETVNLDLARKPLLSNITKCHIGSSIIVGDEIEIEMERVIKNSNLETNIIQSQSEFTGNIVSSVSNNVITCKATVQNILDGDILYTHEGHPIGKVSGVSGTTITIENVHDDTDIDLWYVPSVNDELIKRDKKTFIATNNFTQVPAFDALNSLASKKGLDFTIKGKKVIFRNVNDTSLLRKQTISYKSHKIISIEKSTSMFAKADIVTVIGDRIQATANSGVRIEDVPKQITVVDPTIRNISDAKIKAGEVLQLHQSDAEMITLRILREGLETLEAGDVVYLDFPRQNIKPNDYMIFEIENVLSPILTMTVGTFNKTIAERLSEINTQLRTSNATTYSVNSEIVGGGIYLQDSISLKTTLVEYTITGTGETSNLGFDDVFGFTEEVGFETGTVVISSYSSED